MPRRLPRYDQEFIRRAGFALSCISHIEQARVLGLQSGDNLITLADVEYTYELAFLRIFLGWEQLLEDAFTRLICGYSRSGGQEPLRSGTNYYGTIAHAEAAILGSRDYELWHSPTRVIQRARQFLTGSHYELVIASASARITHLAAIRHRIAHSQTHAERQFDAATMSLAGKRYRASRPGRFLRDWVSGSMPPSRWISTLAVELGNLAVQICS
jgi:hypothetical protein